MPRAKSKGSNRNSRMLFIWFFLVAFLIAVVVKRSGFTLEKALNESGSEMSQSESQIRAVKLNFDPDSKFVYQVSVPDNYVRKTNKELAGVAYPKELTQLSDSDLYKVMCGSVYRAGEGGFEAFERGFKKTLNDKDPHYSYYLDTLKSFGAKMSYFWGCSLEDGPIVYGYGGTLNVGRSIGYVQMGRERLEVGSDQIQECTKVLAVTKNKVVYLECGGDEDGERTNAILALDFGSMAVRRLMNCKTDGYTMRREANVKCEM